MSEVCDGCDGTKKCLRCDGTGLIRNYDILMACTVCDSTGVCDVCAGSGEAPPDSDAAR
jgi:DnaJ-class molecular chaperone